MSALYLASMTPAAPVPAQSHLSGQLPDYLSAYFLVITDFLHFVLINSQIICFLPFLDFLVSPRKDYHLTLAPQFQLPPSPQPWERRRQLWELMRRRLRI